MLIYAIFVTFVLGALVGSVLTITIALKMEQRSKMKKDVAVDVVFDQNKSILDYSKSKVGPNPFV